MNAPKRTTALKRSWRTVCIAISVLSPIYGCMFGATAVVCLLPLQLALIIGLGIGRTGIRFLAACALLNLFLTGLFLPAFGYRSPQALVLLDQTNLWQIGSALRMYKEFYGSPEPELINLVKSELLPSESNAWKCPGGMGKLDYRYQGMFHKFLDPSLVTGHPPKRSLGWDDLAGVDSYGDYLHFSSREYAGIGVATRPELLSQRQINILFDSGLIVTLDSEDQLIEIVERSKRPSPRGKSGTQLLEDESL